MVHGYTSRYDVNVRTFYLHNFAEERESAKLILFTAKKIKSRHCSWLYYETYFFTVGKIIFENSI